MLLQALKGRTRREERIYCLTAYSAFSPAVITTCRLYEVLLFFVSLCRQTGEAEVHRVFVQVFSSHLGGCSVAASACQQRQTWKEDRQRRGEAQVRLTSDVFFHLRSELPVSSDSNIRSMGLLLALRPSPTWQRELRRLGIKPAL